MQPYLFLSTAVLVLLGWLASLCYRKERWAFAGWFPFSAINALIVLQFFYSMTLIALSSGDVSDRELALPTRLFSLNVLHVVLLIISFLFRPCFYPKEIVIPTILLSIVSFVLTINSDSFGE